MLEEQSCGVCKNSTFNTACEKASTAPRCCLCCRHLEELAAVLEVSGRAAFLLIAGIHTACDFSPGSELEDHAALESLQELAIGTGIGLSSEVDSVAKLAAITVLVLLAGLPLWTPLLMLGPCCPEQCGPMVRANSSCCSMGALPDTVLPARVATGPEVAVPAPACLPADAGMVLREALPAAVPLLIRTASFQTPLRI